MPVQFQHFGFHNPSQGVLLHDFTWNPPITGICHLHGEWTKELGHLMARQSVEDGFYTWGTLTYKGIDWRIRPPAAFLDDKTNLRPGSIQDNLQMQMPAGELISSIQEGTTKNWLVSLLTRHQLQALDLDANIETLSPNQRQQVILLGAIARGPSVLYLHGPSWRNEALHNLMQSIAQNLLVILADTSPHETSSIELPSPSPPYPPKPARWFQWFLHDKLAGMPQPGRAEEIKETYSHLKAQGVTHVLCLEETHTSKDAADHELITWHFPMDDMGVPTTEATRHWCAKVHEAWQEGACVALHCKAGIGRTGTVAAVLLMTQGYQLAEALMLLRGWNHHYVQSSIQMDFLKDWNNHA